MRFNAGTDEWVLGAGGFVYLPRGLIHQPMVEGEHPATVSAVLSRPGLEDFFAEFSSELAKSAALNAPVETTSSTGPTPHMSGACKECREHQRMRMARQRI
jgi:ribosomal protein L16 Arg81 hydroxylase